MTMMTYKGYEAAVECDEDVGIFHGEVINPRDVITFQGKSARWRPDARWRAQRNGFVGWVEPFAKPIVWASAAT
jgi:hypothetical protein